MAIRPRVGAKGEASMYFVSDGDFAEGHTRFLEEFLTSNYTHADADADEQYGEFRELAVNLVDGVAQWRGTERLMLYIEEHYEGDDPLFYELTLTEEEYRQICEAFADETGCIYLEYEE